MMRKGEWTFLTNHGRLLAHLAKHRRSTTQEIAQEACLSIRTVQKIITDLERGGYITRHKEGRRNHYKVNLRMPMRHPMDQANSVGDLLLGLGDEPHKKRVSGKEVDNIPVRA